MDDLLLKTSELRVGDEIKVSSYWYKIDIVENHNTWVAFRLSRPSSDGSRRLYKNITSPISNLHQTKSRKADMTLEEVEVKVYQSLGDLDIKIHRYVDSLALPDMVEVAPTISVERKVITGQTHKEMIAELNKLVEFVRQF